MNKHLKAPYFYLIYLISDYGFSLFKAIRFIKFKLLKGSGNA